MNRLKSEQFNVLPHDKFTLHLNQFFNFFILN